jgi:hypothetical protein
MDLGSLGLVAWLTRLLWKPKPTRVVLGFPLSVAERLRPSLESLGPHASPELISDIKGDARAIFAECLAERDMPSGVYKLLIEPEGNGRYRALVTRPRDGKQWSLEEFDDFMDLGLHAAGGQST